MRPVKDRIRLILGLTVVTLSLLLVFVVGYGQALKSYRQLTTDTVMAQTEAARLGIEQVLNSGVSLEDIAGLSQVLQPIVESDVSVTGLRLLSGQKQLYRFGETQEYDNSISIPLNNKFTQAGTLQVVLSDQIVESTVTKSFQPFIWLIVVLLAVFIGSVLNSTHRTVYLTSFTMVFLAMSVSVMILVGSLYRDGLQSKAVSLAEVVSQRLSPILIHNVDQTLVVGIESMLDNFRRTNPELSKIAVFKNTQLVATSQQGGAMTEVISDTGMLDYAIGTSLSGEVHLTYKAQIVIAQLARTLKNFAVLFFACGLVCFAFIRLLSGEANQSRNDVVLERIKPLFLGAVLMESLMAPIMPQYMTSVAESAGLGASASSIFFTLYFLGFALTLLPAARLIEMYDIRRVLVFGIFLSSLGCGLLSIDPGLAAILSARLLSGIGQALIFISVQGYILRFSNKGNKTQAAGIIVFCFNAGFIAGAAIGALLADYLGDQGTFTLAASIGGIMSLFSLLLPSMKARQKLQGSIMDNVSAMMADSWRLIKIPTFIRTMLLVGIPTKAALTGIVSFAVPLLLAERGVSKESIGQVLMSYAAIVLLVSHKVGPWVDKWGNSKKALCLGNFIAGGALTLLAIAMVMPQNWQIVVVMTLSMMMMGFSHGLINAPVVTHVVVNMADSQESDSVIAATYRFLERFGHISGSVIVGQMLVWLGAEQAMLVLAGFFIAACVLFVFFDKRAIKAVVS
ncbi:MFS transporter [Photobacterium sp. SDRW27]|uniref:MFS transporter n=1 Tax=Photobacterium obscurum TaxID=2829490 RepID=UPI00224335AB|nr:MFS transporter [Photobacterium obscurum]MCW8327874.1 MFS transporter [Photobacterium obscurum]